MTHGVCLAEPFCTKVSSETPVVVLKLDSDRTRGGCTRIAVAVRTSKNKGSIPAIPIL